MPGPNMRAVTFDSPGQPSVLHAGEVALPAQVKPDEVLIKVTAAGVNRADTMQRLGNYPPPAGASHILGLEVTGRILEVGSEGAGFKAGDRVMALLDGGGYAELVTTPAGQAIKVPDSFSDAEAAGFMETTLTAFLNLFELGGVQPSGSVLIHGGGSGVGTQGIALCKAKGITTFVTAGSDDKCKKCAEHGATYVLNYKTEDWATAVVDATQGRGVDVVLDCVGGPYLDKDLRCLAMDGKIIFIGFLGGAVASNFNLMSLFKKRGHVIGSSLRSRSKQFKARLVRDLQEQFGSEIQNGALTPALDRVYPLAEAADAHAHMESSSQFGKIVLSVAPL